MPLKAGGAVPSQAQAWFQLKWVGQLQGHSITVKELISIVIAAAVWGLRWRGSSIQVLCDNAAVVAILNQNSSRDKEVMHLVRCLAFITAKFQFLLSAGHIPGLKTQQQMLCQETNMIFSTPSTLRPTPLQLHLQQPSWTFCCCPNQTGHPGVGQNCGTIFSPRTSTLNPEKIWFSTTPVPVILYPLSFYTHSVFRTATLPICCSSSSIGFASFYYQMLFVSNKTTSYCTEVGDTGMAKLEQVIRG